MARRIIFTTIAVILFSASVANSQGRGRFKPLMFEGTLLSYSPHPKIACGVLFIHQVAKYRVDKVLSGKYVGERLWLIIRRVELMSLKTFPSEVA